MIIILDSYVRFLYNEAEEWTHSSAFLYGWENDVGLFTIVAVFLIAAYIAVKAKEDFYDTFPMTISGMLLVLYGLAFLGCLSMVDFLSLGIVAGMAAYAVCSIRKHGSEWPKKVVRELASPKSLLLLVAFGTLSFLLKEKAAFWWDDINYWAVDAKALYYNNGFAGKYGNVAPEFGDYPPAIQLFKWFFLHLSPVFKEGLMFGAYHCLNLIYALPLLVRLKKKSPFFLGLGLIGIFLLPGIIDGIAVEGTCADVTMGLVYGAFLWAAYDNEGHAEAFYFIRMALYLSVLVLTKSVGIEWAFFGMVFFLLLYSGRLKEQGLAFKPKWNRVLWVCVPCLFTEGSWLLFCLLNRRVAKLTGAGVKMALGGNFTLPDNTMIKMGHFLRGFAFHPMHIERTWGIDLSALALLVLIVIVVIIFFRTKIFAAWECRRILCFVVLTAFAAYGIIFLGHITIFAGELQYLDDAVMAKSIARYGAPFSVGLIYLLMGAVMEKKNRPAVYGACLAFILLTTSLSGAYQTLYGYKVALAENLSARADMIEEDAQIFLEKAGRLIEEKTDSDIFEKRTLYLRDEKVVHWVKDTYISYEASPIPVVYSGIATDTLTEADMQKRIRESHAKYLYADRVEGNPDALFAGMLAGENFEYETFYEIIDTDGALRLVKIQ